MAMLTCLHTDHGSFHTMVATLNGCDRHQMACKAYKSIWLFIEKKLPSPDPGHQEGCLCQLTKHIQGKLKLYQFCTRKSTKWRDVWSAVRTAR